MKNELPDIHTSQIPSSIIHLQLIVEQRPIGTLTKLKNLQGLKNGLDSDKQINPVKNLEGLNIDNKENLQGFEGYYFIAVVDCTGHGIPGAFMSMIGSRLLNDIVIERKIYSPAKILEQLNIMIRKALRQDTTDNHDGMDVCLCRFQKSRANWELTYAGAKRENEITLFIYASIISKL